MTTLAWKGKKILISTTDYERNVFVAAEEKKWVKVSEADEVECAEKYGYTRQQQQHLRVRDFFQEPSFITPTPFPQTIWF